MNSTEECATINDVSSVSHAPSAHAFLFSAEDLHSALAHCPWILPPSAHGATSLKQRTSLQPGKKKKGGGWGNKRVCSKAVRTHISESLTVRLHDHLPSLPLTMSFSFTFLKDIGVLGVRSHYGKSYIRVATPSFLASLFCIAQRSDEPSLDLKEHGQMEQRKEKL